MSDLGDKLAHMRHELEAKDALVAESACACSYY